MLGIHIFSYQGENITRVGVAFVTFFLYPFLNVSNPHALIFQVPWESSLILKTSFGGSLRYHSQRGKTRGNIRS